MEHTLINTVANSVILYCIYSYDMIFITHFLKPSINYFLLTASPHPNPTHPHPSENCWVRAWCYVML